MHVRLLQERDIFADEYPRYLSTRTHAGAGGGPAINNKSAKQPNALALINRNRATGFSNDLNKWRYSKPYSVV